VSRQGSNALKPWLRIRETPRSSQIVVCDALEQPAIVADQDDAGAHPGQLALQPFDTGQVEMVGGLVQQQDIGRGGQRASQGSAARLAARKSYGVFRAGKAEFFEQI
jgi:hypothetical protein